MAVTKTGVPSSLRGALSYDLQVRDKNRLAEQRMDRSKDKINILFLIFGGQIMGGSERLVYHLASRVNRDRFNPSVAFIKNDILKEFIDLNIPLFEVSKTKRLDLSSMRQISRLIKDNDIHIVNAHHFMPMIYSFYGCKVSNDAKLVYTEHSAWEIEQPPLFWQVVGSYVLSQADGIVGVTQEVATQLRNMFRTSPVKTRAIVNGVDLYGMSRGEDGISKADLNIRENDKVIGIIANFKPIKNHLFLLQAFRELLRDCCGVKLLLIGQSVTGESLSTEREIREFIHTNELDQNVILLGYRKDIPSLLRIMDVCCLTSSREGLPMSLLEAMADGLPLVGTDVEGIRDVIVNGENGLLVKVGDVYGLKCALMKLLGDDSLRARMGQESKLSVARRFSLDRCVKEYEELFMSVSLNENVSRQSGNG